MADKRKLRVLLVSNNSGTAFWRVKNPLEFLRDGNYCDLTWVEPDRIPTRDRYWLEWYDVVVFHQIWSDDMVIVAKYMKTLGKRIILSIDDLINGFKIPKFISGGALYRDNGITHNVHDMMEIADKIVVTQPFLADQLAHFYEIPIERFCLFPNLPSFNWLGRYIKPEQKVAQFKNRKGNLRIGVISSLSHYDKDKKSGEDGKEGQSIIPEKDDLELLVGGMKELKDRKVEGLTWVMPVNNDGNIIGRVKPFAQMENVKMTQIRDYPNAVSRLDLDLVVVPLQKNDFNDSKSNIKLLECAALGIPLLASDSFAYEGFLDRAYMFGDEKELAAKVIWVKSWSEKQYGDLVVNNYRKFFEAQSDYYGRKLNAYWLEANLQLVGDTFLEFSDCVKKDENGIVAPTLKKEDTNNGKTKEG